MLGDRQDDDVRDAHGLLDALALRPGLVRDAAASAPARIRANDGSLPSSSRLSYRPGDTREPVTATRIGRYTVRGFSPRSSHSFLSAASISPAPQCSTRLERVCRSGEDPRVEERRVRIHVVEEEPGELGKLAEAADLLLHERRCGAHALGGPVESLLAQVDDEPRGVLVDGEVAEVDAVHPVELRVVERRGARPRRARA